MKTNGFILGLFLVALISACAPKSTPSAANMSSEDYVYKQPSPTNSPLATSSLTSQNIDAVEINNIVKDILDNRYGGIDSVLIARNGAMVLEQYFNGYHRDKKHDMRSATKSIAGLLAGIAIDSGDLAGQDDSIYDYFSLYENFDHWSNLKNEITIQHLLNMTAGWECNERVKTSAGHADKMYRNTDWAKFILDLSMTSRPGEIFSYCTGGVGLLGNLIGLAVGKDVADYAQEKLFTPLGISNYHFQTDPLNNSHLGGQMYLTPLAMLKIGQLFLNNGNWDGNQIVSAQWISASKTPYFPWFSNLWWIWEDTIESVGAKVTFYYASGNGGQKIFIVPAYNLVVVFTASEYDNPAAGNGQRILVNRIIPAMN